LATANRPAGIVDGPVFRSIHRHGRIQCTLPNLSRPAHSAMWPQLPQVTRGGALAPPLAPCAELTPICAVTVEGVLCLGCPDELASLIERRTIRVDSLVGAYMRLSLILRVGALVCFVVVLWLSRKGVLKGRARRLYLLALGLGFVQGG
jgi:hypothetical protein